MSVDEMVFLFIMQPRRMSMKADVVIIGGGVIGTSNGNSGIIHAGYNADFKTLKGRLNIKSNPRFDKLCQDLKVRFKRIGSLVVGFNEQDMKKLRDCLLYTSPSPRD